MYDQHVLTILSSENTISLGFPLHLIGVVAVSDNSNQILNDLEWHIFPNLHQIKLENQTLLIEEGFNVTDEIIISCSHHESGMMATRIFKINPEHRIGSVIHFIKPDHDYYGNHHAWDLWTYGHNGQPQGQVFTGTSNFGQLAIVSNSHVVARCKAWGEGWANEWSDQSIAFEIPNKHANYYIIYGDEYLYSSLDEVITRTNPRVDFAVMDEANIIKAYLSHDPLPHTEFHIHINKQRYIGIHAQVNIEAREVVFSDIPVNIYPFDVLEVIASNTFAPCKVLMRDYLNQFYYPDDDMGISFNHEHISLRLWAPTAYKVELAVYNSRDQSFTEANQIYPMSFDTDSGTHYAMINREANENKYYLYRLSFNDLDRDLKPYIKITYAVDPYASSVSVNGQMGALVDINTPALMPKEWDKDKTLPPLDKEDSILYEMHLRDFTVRHTSNVSVDLRGKYLGAVESGSIYIDESGITVSTGIDSLVELGVTHVHLLPVFDFSSVDETLPDESRNWGYDPQNYNVPEGSYSRNPYDPSLRIEEVRKMIHGFHEKGIRVVMDMVYNHMTNTRNFDNIVPRYYFRSDKKGKFTNGSGCGNEIASERPMVRKFIVDSILHWLNDYKIDGIRLDLMELMDFETMRVIVKKTHAIDPNFLIYGEPWKGGDSPLQNGTYRGMQKNEEFSIFNDIFRDAIRGNNNPGNGFVNGEQHNPTIKYSLMEGLKGSINGLTARFKETINYVDAHDNYTLWDHIEKSQNHELAIGEYRKNLPNYLFDSFLVRQNLLALGIILTSQGIPFLQGGVEFLRTKQGDHNSYKSNDQINAIYWEDKAKFRPVFDYVKGLIELRRKHPAFRMNDRSQIDRHMNIQFAHSNPSSGVVMLSLFDNANSDDWKNILVFFNGTSIDNYDINNMVPVGEWTIVVNHEQAGVDAILYACAGKLPFLRAHSLLVMYN